jgi:hypothetical protein
LSDIQGKNGMKEERGWGSDWIFRLRKAAFFFVYWDLAGRFGMVFLLVK